MARKDFWKSDWFLGVAMAVVVLVISRTDFVQSMERTPYDLGVRASNRTPSDRVAVIAIDDNRIANLGRWPWPRDAAL
jgi:eukaryotic-like serine/threonine-protein kinase